MSHEHISRPLRGLSFIVWINLLVGCASVIPTPADKAGVDIVDINVSANNIDPANIEEEETPANWGDVKPTLFAPDPEHSPISAADEIDADILNQEMDGLPAANVTEDIVDGHDGLAMPATEDPMLAPAIWGRIRAGFQFNDRTDQRVIKDKRWYAKHQAYLDRVFERAEPYLHYITEEIARRGMPMELALLPVVESAYQPFAYSRSRASGLWQFIPGTAQHYGLKLNWWYDGRRDVFASTDAALTYLQMLANMFDGDWLLALAAYNSGEGKVAKEIARNRRLGKPTDFWSLSLPRETRGYVPKLLAIVDIVSNPARHGLSLRYIPDTPYLAEIDTGTQIDLMLASELVGMPVEEILRLNPGFNRWASDPNGPHRLLVPLSKADEVKQKLAALPAERRIRWERHIVRKGETLDRIAKHYQTTAAVLQQANRLTSKKVRHKHPLIIPVAQQTLALSSLGIPDTRVAANAAEGEKLEHTVRSGDTLWNIAKKYGVSIKSILQWNAMALKDIIKSGQRLIIWLTPKAAIATEQPSSSPALSDYRQRVHYTVRRGDSLSLIAERFNVDIAELRAWNKKTLVRKNHLLPGQRLTVFVDTTIADKI